MWCYLVNDTEDPRFEPCLSTIHHLRFLICITSYYLDATKCFMLNNKVKKRPRIALKVYFIISQLVLFAPNRKVRNQLSSSGSLVVNTLAFYSDDSSSNSDDVYSFPRKIAWKERKIMTKRPAMARVKKDPLIIEIFFVASLL